MEFPEVYTMPMTGSIKTRVIELTNGAIDTPFVEWLTEFIQLTGAQLGLELRTQWGNYIKHIVAVALKSATNEIYPSDTLNQEPTARDTLDQTEQF